MIIIKTPLRISFAGGGSDIPGFYRRCPGATISTAINKYIFISINKSFEDIVRVSYSKTEIVKNYRDLEHTRVRAGLDLHGIENGVEIVTMADIPSKGTGLGSSSSFTVGLLRALYAYKGEVVSEERLASEACTLEIDSLGEPIGRQDQYIASYGGFRFMEYKSDDSVLVNYVSCSLEVQREIEDSILLFYTGITRSTSDILSKQIEAYGDVEKFENTKKMVSLAYELREAVEAGRTDDFGRILHDGWMLKRSLTADISNNKIDDMYEIALKNGALGGKLLGAGGGGFLLVYAKKNNHQRIKNALNEYKSMTVKFEPEGSKTLYIDRNF